MIATPFNTDLKFQSPNGESYGVDAALGNTREHPTGSPLPESLCESWLEALGPSKYKQKRPDGNRTSALLPVQDSGIDIGDITARKALRKQLQCKTFRWYLVSVYPEMRMYSDIIAYGVVRSLCL